MEREAEIEKDLAQKHPELLEPFRAARIAFDAQNYAEAEAAANLEIKQSIESRRPLQNLYELNAPEAAEFATELEKALNRPTTEDDTHPSPQDRFRLVAKLQQPASPPRSGEVWDLFKDPESIRREMVEWIEKQVAPHRTNR